MVASDQREIACGGIGPARTEPSGLVFDIMRYSLHNGPGIRTTVFLKGCPLSCWWCHNPESQAAKPQLIYFEDRCRQCGDCIAACPHHAISLAGDAIRTSIACQACGTCVAACLANARELVGRAMTVAQVIAEIEKDFIFFDESGGGVSFSGGEPLLQPAFLEALLDACRQRRIHTVLDTCGLVKHDLLLRLSEKADLILYDLKLVDSTRHQQHTGVSNDCILQNLEALARSNKEIIIRFPVVPGVNDSDEDVEQMLSFLTRLPLRRIDLLPYHQMGIAKYRRLRLPYRLDSIAPPTPEHMQKIAHRFARAGFTVRIGG